MTIGEKIRYYRKQAGLTQTELAAKINKALRTVQKYEKDEIELSIRVALEIANVLNITALDIISDEIGVTRCLDCKNYNGLAECKLLGECGGTDFFCGWGCKN